MKLEAYHYRHTGLSSFAQQILKSNAVWYAENGHTHSDNLLLKRTAQYVDQNGGELVGPFLMKKAYLCKSLAITEEKERAQRQKSNWYVSCGFKSV